VYERSYIKRNKAPGVAPVKTRRALNVTFSVGCRDSIDHVAIISAI
jgi:hypothetical protein